MLSQEHQRLAELLDNLSMQRDPQACGVYGLKENPEIPKGKLMEDGSEPWAFFKNFNYRCYRCLSDPLCRFVDLYLLQKGGVGIGQEMSRVSTLEI